MRTKNERLKVTSNEKERIFTIQSFINGDLFATYETIEMSQEEFEENENNTENDWRQFLKTDNYYVI